VISSYLVYFLLTGTCALVLAGQTLNIQSKEYAKST